MLKKTVAQDKAGAALKNMVSNHHGSIIEALMRLR
jgi:hypothetical protein